MEQVMAATGAVRLIWLLPVLPLIGWAINTAFGRRLGVIGGWIATLLVAAAFAIALAAFIALLHVSADNRLEVLRGWRWFSSGGLQVGMDLRFDPLTAMLTLLITGVGGLIHLYSIGYMRNDRRIASYFAWLNLFAASMLVLVLAENFLVMFLGWEGVGLCSYLLVGFWYDRPGIPPAATKAFVTNRIGDFGFLVAMFLLFVTFRTLDFQVIFNHVSALSPDAATAVALLFFLACAGKSAQIPLYVWLPDAMAGPTPVSALIHAATMVTAGVFLVARTHVFFQASPTAAAVVVVIGACTALLAALIAIGQDDIKRGLAYSTVSQLGYMFIGVGLGPIGYVAGIFHLLTHGFFKAQLFLSSGSVMHANDEDQDMKRYGGLARFMPVTAVTMGVAYLAIIGFPPFSGYFSKGQILDAAFHHGGVGYFGWALGVITVAITAFYMSRLYILTFLGKPRWPAGRHPHESPWIMTIPLIALALLAAFGGVLNLTPTGWLAHFLAPVFGGLPPTPTTGPSDLALEAITLALMVVGILAGWFVYGSGKIEWISLRVRFAPAWRLLANKFYVDEIYEFFTVTIGKAVAAFMAVSVEGAIDGAVNGVAEVVAAGANRGRRVQSGLVRSYALGVLLGAVVLIALVVAVWVGGGT